MKSNCTSHPTFFRKFFTQTALIAALFLIGWGTGLSQRTINGTVYDAEFNEPLIGANVFVKGAQIGTVTDFDGNFTLEVPDSAQILVFSYTGYQSQEIALGDQSEFTVSMSAGELLDEVVVIGYGTVKRDDATGSVQTVSSGDFNRGAITAPQDLLAGKVAGVTIVTDGSPGGGATIRIRGESSLSANNDPLIVVDGVPLDNSDVAGSRNILNIINPNDIETFTVLKDASASAIYGNRAAGGVILITTKKGDYGQKFSVGYNGNVSIGTPMNTIPVPDGDTYRDLIFTRYDSTHPSRELMGMANTDWQDEIYRNAIGTDHQVYFSGGLSWLPYRVSLGYTNQQGLLDTDQFQRFTTAVSLTPGFFDNTLQVKLNVKGMFNQNDFADRGAIGNALTFDPTQSVFDENSPYGGYTTWTIANGNPNQIAPTNPRALLDQRSDQSDVNRLLANLALDYRLWFLPDLRLNLNIATDRSSGEGNIVVPTDAAFAFNAITGGGVNNIYSQSRKNDLLEFYANYKKAFGRHDIDLVGGYSWQHFEIENDFTNSDAAGTPSQTVSGSDPAEYYLLSYYGRLNYGYADRLLVTLTLRRDGTSRFAPENRWGTFPAVAVAGKVISNDNQYFNNLKLRVGWGQTGQQEIGDFYAYLARYQIGTINAQYQFGGEAVTTLRANGYDANIQWETTETYNIGVDFSIIRDRFGGALDLYRRNTTDLLNRIPVPAGTNLTNFITTNVGDMENRGVELALNGTPLRTEKLNLDLGFNIAYNENEITRLTATEDPDYAGVATGGIAGGVGSNIQIHSVGFAPRSFYVYEQLYDEDGTLLEGQYADRNGDGEVNSDDLYRYQKPAADVTLGFNGRFSFYNFDFSFQMRSSFGNYVYNNVQTDMGWLNRLYNSNGSLSNINQSAIDLNVEEQSSLTFSDHFVKRADFTKIDHMTLGYTFDELLGNFFRVYFTVQNAAIFTKYDGLDPEIFDGIDNNIYPRPRTFLLGVSVEF